MLDAIWQASTKTAWQMVSLPVRLDPRGCNVPGPEPVILDGVVRDRCPYVGDLAVIAKTMLVSGTGDFSALRRTLLMFARAQHSNGAIPSSPYLDFRTVLIDYPAYWVEATHDYVLHTGDLAFAREVYPVLSRLMDGWYPSLTRADGLIVNTVGTMDYGYIRRTGNVVGYYNAGYARALGFAAKLAAWTGHPVRASAWDARSVRVAARIRQVFWDETASAFLDSEGGSVAHPQDANAFAVLAGAGTMDEGKLALDFLAAHNQRGWGNTMVENNAFDDSDWGTHGHERVYPFISYFEVDARFRLGLGSSALDQLRRGWGYMLTSGPGDTTWEAIGTTGGPFQGGYTSFSSGWSSGGAPALTYNVLGVRPLTPGFATFTVKPIAPDLASASGEVWTPHGPIRVVWGLNRYGKRSVNVRAPAGTKRVVT